MAAPNNIAEAYKALCLECGWRGESKDLLQGPSPFDPDDTIYACPTCKSVSGTIVPGCDFPGCTKQSSGGHPTADGGYAMRCHEHYDREAATGPGAAGICDVVVNMDQQTGTTTIYAIRDLGEGKFEVLGYPCDGEFSGAKMHSCLQNLGGAGWYAPPEAEAKAAVDALMQTKGVPAQPPAGAVH